MHTCKCDLINLLYFHKE